MAFINLIRRVPFMGEHNGDVHGRCEWLILFTAFQEDGYLLRREIWNDRFHSSQCDMQFGYAKSTLLFIDFGQRDLPLSVEMMMISFSNGVTC
ncbi:hypothetical protein CEXT_757061 [Caerostris extrusa]|uniref:Uncharacterized protein n=1 Tax=Caerostris extrusa TaxID=172846 RepID=A0AAV4QHK8_CAEEX|nr:hypothetical protein CEXT_757061 [Caerostris extrusa]